MSETEDNNVIRGPWDDGRITLVFAENVAELPYTDEVEAAYRTLLDAGHLREAKGVYAKTGWTWPF